MYCYNLFNNLFYSEIRLPIDLCQISTDEKVSNYIYFSKNNKSYNDEFSHKIAKLGKCLYKTAGGYLIDKVVCKFFISGSNSSIYILGEEQNINYITIYLLGEVLAFYFRLKGIFQLHACMVNKGNTTIVMCGSSGNGKSTLANEFLLNGWNMLCDDHSIINLHDNSIYGSPSFPYIKMFCNDQKMPPRNMVFEIPSTGKGLFEISRNVDREIFSKNYKLSHIFFLNLSQNPQNHMKATLIDSFTAFEKLINSCYANLRSNGDMDLLKRDLECISLLSKMSKSLPHYELLFSIGYTPSEVIKYIVQLIGE